MIFVEKDNLNHIIKKGDFYNNISFGINASREDFISQGLYELTEDPMPELTEYDILKTYTVIDEDTKIITIKYEIIDLTLDDPKLLKSKLKKIGKPYELNNVVYQIPLTKEAQDTMVALAVSFQLGGIDSTNIEFDNGTTMPISGNEFMAFAGWFATERNSFFINQSN
ncbi:MAG: hypothetical protein PHI79_03440 [Sulfurovaceae bacterium]|nr:hypothetical protein [Sulfurovaceae bacterium]MDD5548635.1 hypothetical protein [Sulfurovaceae bacterium]